MIIRSNFSWYRVDGLALRDAEWLAGPAATGEVAGGPIW